MNSLLKPGASITIRLFWRVIPSRVNEPLPVVTAVLSCRDTVAPFTGFPFSLMMVPRRLTGSFKTCCRAIFSFVTTSAFAMRTIIRSDDDGE